MCALRIKTTNDAASASLPKYYEMVWNLPSAWIFPTLLQVTLRLAWMIAVECEAATL
jgi:hypothetical protein